MIFWDLFGEQGHPVRTTVTEMGPLLLARLLELNDTQEGVLNIAFRIADEQGLLLLDLKDLRALLQLVAENAGAAHDAVRQRRRRPSVGTIQRQLLVLENQGGDQFFGEPALDIKDLMRTDRDGRGIVNVLAADKLMDNPRLYATFLLWLLSELFEELPEVGDLDKPKLVFFFDEAHLLFDDAPKALLDKVEQVVRLIRSKGVGVYFVTQNPLDVPDTVLGQLGNRVQHALRAFTPRDQKAVRAAAETFRQNPAFDTEKAITELGVGEALVSMLEGKGAPSMVERTHDRAADGAGSAPITPHERQRDHRREPAARQVRADDRSRSPPTRCWRSAPKHAPPRRTRNAARKPGRAASSTRSASWMVGTVAPARASPLGRPDGGAARSPGPSSTRRSAGHRGRTRQIRRRPARAAPSAAPSCAEPWAGC